MTRVAVERVRTVAITEVVVYDLPSTDGYNASEIRRFLDDANTLEAYRLAQTSGTVQSVTEVISESLKDLVLNIRMYGDKPGG